VEAQHGKKTGFEMVSGVFTLQLSLLGPDQIKTFSPGPPSIQIGIFNTEPKGI